MSEPSINGPQTADVGSESLSKDSSLPTAPVKEGRKQLPSIPDSDTQATMDSRINKQFSHSKDGSGYGPYFLEYSLMAEYQLLHKQKLPGVYVIPSALSPLVWNCVMFIRQGPYQEAVFRFTMHISENYPDGDCPTIMFDYPVFHPVVHPSTGELDVKRAFPKWRRNVKLWQVLLYARRIFFKIDTKSPWNQEAADLYEKDAEAFKKRAKETVQDSKNRLYEPPNTQDPFAIRFSHWNSDVHEDCRKQMLNPKKSQSEEDVQKRKGLSWMLPDSNQIFSREDPATA